MTAIAKRRGRRASRSIWRQTEADCSRSALVRRMSKTLRWTRKRIRDHLDRARQYAGQVWAANRRIVRLPTRTRRRVDGVLAFGVFWGPMLPTSPS